MNFLRKLMLVVMVATIAAGFVGAQDSRLQKILTSGVLRVGTTGDFDPMTVRDPATNTYKGFDIDVVTELANDMGVRIVFVPTEWKTLVNGIVADKYDLTTSASITTARIRSAGFSDPYYHVGTVPLVLKQNLSKFRNGWADINKPNVKLAVSMGTSQEQQANTYLKNVQLRKVEAPATHFQEVLSRRADVSITSYLECTKLIQTYSQLAIVPVDKPISPADLAFMTAQDDIVWINFLNHWIQIKKNIGFFEDLEKKWMPAD
jgi:cyclohexadienyl dehydratase